MQKLIFSYIVFYYHMLLTTETLKQLECLEGNNATFPCTCCSEHYRFKKIFQGGYILLNGEVKQPHKYHFDEHKTHITLKDCAKDDEGIYVWMCGERNVNNQFHLEVVKVTTRLVDCLVGGKVSFKCPCCPDELDSCRFKKLEQEGYIVRDGVLSVHHHPRYEIDDQKTHITLEECNEDDEGTYVWMCGKCNVIEKFSMKIRYSDQQGYSADVHKSLIQEMVLSFFLILIILLLAPWKYLYRSFLPSCLGWVLISSVLKATKKLIWQYYLGDSNVLGN